MKLPRPSEQLAGCVWLPRILAKARLFQSGALPPDYAANFCQAKGVDALFMAHFGLTREDVLAAAAQPDADAVERLLGRAGAKRVAEWNDTGMNLGRPGYPLAERLPIALATTYKHVASSGATSVFEMLEADEKEA